MTAKFSGFRRNTSTVAVSDAFIAEVLPRMDDAAIGRDVQAS